MFGRSVACLALVALGCGRNEAVSVPVPAVSAANSVSVFAAPALADAAAEAGALAAWPALVRAERWDAAWSVLQGLPAAEQSLPEVRYARARVALARQDAESARALLDGLESALPLLADDIAHRRAEVALVAGPFADAGEWFGARPDPTDQLESARAFEKAKDARRARAAVAHVLASAKKTRTQEADARALRLSLADPPGDVEQADARWLAVSGADVSPIDGLALVTRVDAKHPLTARELLDRAEVLSEAGRADDALRAITLSAGAPGANLVTELERSRARGWTLFHARGRGGEAARVLAECAAAGGTHAAEDAFHAARALSRADRDEEAIRGYEDVERRFPKSTWADMAAFFAPYLQMLHGEWKECAPGFDAYLRAHPHGEREHDARRDGGLCHLLNGDTKAARVLFERLSDDERADAVLGARMANMAALAALRDGDRTHAVSLWTEVVRAHPLGWPALVARARLVELGAPLPRAVDEAGDPTPPPPPLAVSIPAPADMLHGMGLEADAEAALRERETAISTGAGSRGLELLCDLYGQLERARRRYQLSQSLPANLLATVPAASTRWAWDCAFPTPYPELVHDAEAGEHLPAGLVWSVMRQESGFDPNAASPARALGLMQILPETARPVADELAIDGHEARLTHPSFAIRAGAHLLHNLLTRFHESAPLAVAAYNAGVDPLERWLSRAPGMQLDTFVERIPFDETREYVVRVMGNLARYGYLAGGEDGVPRVDLDLSAK